jgi:hypothetical protein
MSEVLLLPSLPFFARRNDFVGQDGILRRIVNPPPEKFAACRYVGQPILAAAGACRRRSLANPVEVGRTPCSAAGPLASLPRVRRETRKRRAFIAFSGPLGYGDTVGSPPQYVEDTRPLLRRVFISIGGSQAHEDRQDCLLHNGPKPQTVLAERA